MNQEIIKVELLAIDADTDVLRFHISQDSIDVNLNDDACQTDFKKVFSGLIKKAIDTDITLYLSIPDDYTRGMYKEVCTEYIDDLNRELSDITTKLREQL